MSLQSPRRIFRRSQPHRTLRPGRIAATLLLLGCGVGLGLMLAGPLRRSEAPAPAPPPASARVGADPVSVAVVDGQTLRLSGTVVRLDGVRAPRRGEPCAANADCGGAAAAMLHRLVRDRRVECSLSGQDSAGRVLGRCDAEGTDVNRALVASGWAFAQGGRPTLAQAERFARRERLGLWASN